MAGDLELAASLVHAAGTLAGRMRRGDNSLEHRAPSPLEISHKTSISDVVTAADHAAEALIAGRLRAERSADALLGEEGSSFAGTGNGRTWYIDPVDGTYNFASGLPLWCSALALVDAGAAVQPETATIPTLGAVYQATTDELWIGGINQPTTLNGNPLEPLGNPRLADISVASYLHPTTLPDDDVRIPLLRAIQPAATVRMLGSGSIELACVAAGRLGAFVQYDCLPWDWFPGSALVRAAGGTTRVIELRGRRWHVAATAGVVDEICALLLDG